MWLHKICSLLSCLSIGKQHSEYYESGQVGLLISSAREQENTSHFIPETESRLGWLKQGARWGEIGPSKDLLRQAYFLQKYSLNFNGLAYLMISYNIIFPILYSGL